MINISTEFSKSEYILDKTTQSLSGLPFNYEDCKIKTNQYVTKENFNTTIEKLYKNFLYGYRGCFVGSFNVYNTYLYSVSTSNNYPYFEGVVDNYTFRKVNFSSLSGSIGGVCLPINNNTNTSYVFFANDKSVTCMDCSEESVKFVFNTGYIDPLSGDIKFENISDIKFDNNENLYIVDKVYNNIYQYNIKNFLMRENIYQEKLFIKNLIGGLGDANENNKFDGVLNVAVDENYVIAQDVNNKCFKLYNINLNWISTSIFIKIFEEVKYFDAVCLSDGILYCGSGSFIYKFQIEKDIIVYIDKYDITKYFTDGENGIKKIEVVSSNKNVLYVVTNRTVKKVWKSTLNYVMGEFNSLNLGNREVSWLATNKFYKDFDLVVMFIFDPTNENGNFNVNLDNVFYDTILNDTDFNIYSQDECFINQEEYIQSFTVLKNLEKIYYNTILLLQNIKYKFLEDVSKPYPLIIKKLYNQQFLGFTNSLEYGENFDIGVNEIFQAEVINRCIKLILQMQEILAVFFVNNKDNKVYYSPNPGRNKPSIKSYIYFSDGSVLLTPNPAKIEIFEELSPAGGIVTSLGGAPYTGLNGITVEQGVNV